MTKQIPKQVTDVISELDKLPLQMIYEYGDVVRQAVILKQQAWWGSDEQKALAKLQAKKNADNRQHQAQLAAMRREKTISTVKPGMLVKMTGTRDGHGLRYVTEITSNLVFCQQIRPLPRAKHDIDPSRIVKISDGNGGAHSWYTTNYGTDHALSKVMGIFTEDESGVLQYEKF